MVAGMSLPGSGFWPEGTCRIVQKPEVGQTALQGDNDGLGAVSHIQAHQYYADVRLHISHETSEMWGYPAMGGGDRAQSAFMDNEKTGLAGSVGVAYGLPVLLTDLPIPTGLSA